VLGLVVAQNFGDDAEVITMVMLVGVIGRCRVPRVRISVKR
jgi:hypothetical protein